MRAIAEFARQAVKYLLCLILATTGLGAFFFAASIPVILVQLGFVVIGLLMILMAVGFASDVYLGDA